MKRIATLLAAILVLGALSAHAQLGNILGALGSAAGNNTDDLLNTISKVVYAYTGNTQAVDLPGTWTYQGPALALSSEGGSVLGNVAGTAVSATAENKVAGYLEKFGLKAGAVQFTFNEDLTFTCTVRNIPLNGTWRTIDDGKTVQLQFGRTMRYLSMTGALNATAIGCEMLFDGSKFLAFAKSVLSVVGKSSDTAGAISSLANSYDKMKIGFKLTK